MSDSKPSMKVWIMDRMDRFVSIADLMPLIMKESACIQFSFDEGLLHKKMRCNGRNLEYSDSEVFLSPTQYKSTVHCMKVERAPERETENK